MGAKFSLATSAYTKGGPNQVFEFFSYVKNIFLTKRGPWPNGPPKYATGRQC